MTIEFPHQYGKSRVGTVVEVLPLILLNQLSNREKNLIPQINAKKVPLRKDLPLFHAEMPVSYRFFHSLPDFRWRVV